VLVVLCVRAERSGALALFRTVAEYGVVALLVVLLIPAAAPPPVEVDQGRPAAVERDHQDQDQDQGRQLPPGIRHAVGTWDWLADRWRQASEQAASREASPEASTTPLPRR
jgi:hypothetical protein